MKEEKIISLKIFAFKTLSVNNPFSGLFNAIFDALDVDT